MAKKIKSDKPAKASKEIEKVSIPEQKIQPFSYGPSQIDLIKNTVAKGATDDELKLFLYTAQRTGLDPLTRQIHFVSRWDSKLNRNIGTIQTGIDGYRAIAERTGQLAGIDDAVYEGTDPTSHPLKASVTVYRIVKNIRVPFTASARWDEYAPINAKQAFMWNKMPYLMLGKVAESLALRKAFPLNLSGLYTNEEMNQADYTISTETVKPEAIIEVSEPVIDITPEQEQTPRKSISDKTKVAFLVKELKFTEPIAEKVQAVTGFEFIEDNYPEIINRLELIYKEVKDNKK